MKTLFGFAALAVTALALQAQRVEAQDSTSTSGSTSSSTSSSGSASGSRSGASTTSGTSSNQQRVNQRASQTTNNSIPITLNTGGTGAGNGANGANAVDPAGANGANGSNGGGGSGPSNNNPFYSQSDVTVRTTPTVYAPPVSGGNPCTLAVSGGVSVIGWGAAAGGTFVDQDCARRQQAAMMHNAGYAGPAKEMMCDDKSAYYAFRRAGQPCQLRPEWEPAGVPPSPMVQQQPVPIAPAPQQMVTKDRTTLPRCSRTIQDNCWGG